MKGMLKGIWNSWPSRLALCYLIILLLIAAFANQIANDSGAALIPFGPNEISESFSSFQPPGTSEPSARVHYFGSDKLGRDLASRVVHGTGIVMGIGILSTLLSFMIALILGVLSGYFGNGTIRLNWIQIVLVILLSPLAFYYSHEWAFVTNDLSEFEFVGSRFLGLLISMLILIVLITYGSRSARFKSFYLPLDVLIMKFIEIFRSVPGLFFLLAIFSIVSRPSFSNVVVIIGVLGWPLMARLLRAEIVKVKSEPYVAASRISGLSHWRTLVNHVLPGSLPPLVVAFAFSISSSILIESTLSFLDMGMPHDQPSWGSLLSDARDYFPAWWMAMIPGSLIFLSVLAFNTIGDRINVISNPKEKV